MTENLTLCPISQDPTQEEPVIDDYRIITCPTCGNFKIEGSLIATLPYNQSLTLEGRAILAHYIQQKNEAGEQPFFRGNLINQILKEQTLPKLSEQIDNLIFHLGKNTSVGQISLFNLSTLRSISGGLNHQNTSFLCQHLFDQNFILSDNQSLVFINDKAAFGLTVKGWERFYELEKGFVDRRLAFMAMPFGNTQLDEIYLKWFKPACKALGFDLRRVDEKPEAGIINNKMLVDIRKSRFIIAELTHENRGVYWEAGFAEGLGRPVIYTCSDSYRKSNPLHFDIRQHHTVFWTEEALLDAANSLVVTIQATVPEAALIDVDTIQWT